GDVGALRSDTKAALEDMLDREAARGQTMKELRADSAQTKKALDEYAGKVASFSARLEQLPAIVNQVSNEVQALTQTLIGGYRLEEATLRDRLKAIELVLKQLEPVSVQPTH